ncbi:hypothetical protein GOP47_0029686 [Adiantum capillus-veneris]|nr:hypothetical protein GOP47_0029686 [Adiantum capillus-veneris]
MMIGYLDVVATPPPRSSAATRGTVSGQEGKHKAGHNANGILQSMQQLTPSIHPIRGQTSSWPSADLLRQSSSNTRARMVDNFNGSMITLTLTGGHHSCSCVATALPQQIRRGPGGCLPSYRVYRWCQLLHGLQNPVSIMPALCLPSCPETVPRVAALLRGGGVATTSK